MMELVRSIDLEPDDWLWATWRQRIPRKLPEPTPFNKAECLENFRNLKEGKYSYRIWNKFQEIIPASLSREEAHFWFTVMVSDNKQPGKFHQWIKEIEARSFTGEISLEEVKEAIAFRPTPGLLRPMLSPLSHLFPLEDIIDLMEERDEFLAPWFRVQVLPYLTEERAEELRHYLRTKLKNSQWSNSIYNRPSAIFYLAAYLGIHDRIETLVESWPDDLYSQGKKYNPLRSHHRPEVIIFGLRSANLVEKHIKRFQIKFDNQDYVRAWLAHTEYSALNWVCESILKAEHQGIRTEMIKVLTLVKAPEVSPYMLELMLNVRTKLASRWLDDNIKYAIAGLLPLTSNKSRLGAAAVKFIQRTNRKGYGDFIRSCIAATSVSIPANVRKSIVDGVSQKEPRNAIPKWLHNCIQEVSKSRSKINWVDSTDLPNLIADNYCLTGKQIDLFLIALKQSNLTEAHPLLTAIKNNYDSEILDNFAWSLFERWLEVGSPPKDKWVLFAVGLLGTDTSVLKLVPMIRDWPKTGKYKRAEIGLQCLTKIGTDTALMQISEMAKGLRFGSLNKKANECMEAIAARRNLTIEELEDRIVPDCGLDTNSSRIFDYGSRQFYLVIGAEMKPMIKDKNGQVKRSLPKPGKNDDAELAEKAIAEFKLLKKQLTEVIKAQGKRLERAMVNGRTWSRQEFESFFVRHPLMGSFARSLIWGGYDNSGQLILTFRLTEDKTYANIEDKICHLETIAKIGILHPAELSETQRLTWIELLSDYEIMPPFEQLNRQVFGLKPEEIESKEIRRYQEMIVHHNILSGILKVTGWQQDTVYYKSFDRANITAIVEVGSNVWLYRDRIMRCFFVSGVYPNAYLDYERAIKLEDVDAVVMSEVLRNLWAIASKGSQDPPF